MSAKPILCVGQIVADVVVRPVDALPTPGQLSLLEDMQLVPGGCACNTAAVLAKLGASVHVTGLVGRDALGEAIMGQVSRFGVTLDSVAWTDEAPTTAVVVAVASDGQRTFLYRPGCNEQFRAEMVPAGSLDEFGVVHVGGAMKLLALDFASVLCRAQRSGCVTSLDTDFDPTGGWMDIIGPALPHLDFLMTNEDEGAFLTGEKTPEAIGRRLREMGPPSVIVKLGAQGSLLVDSEGARHFPAYPVKVLDTTCAGDAFAAGFLQGLSMGRDLGDCMRLGNAAGALSTTQVSHFGVVSLAQTLKLAGL